MNNYQTPEVMAIFGLKQEESKFIRNAKQKSTALISVNSLTGGQYLQDVQSLEQDQFLNNMEKVQSLLKKPISQLKKELEEEKKENEKIEQQKIKEALERQKKSDRFNRVQPPIGYKLLTDKDSLWSI
ncbi:hypothetical protein PPERSA_08488 [Pseudocohnilembus persalinus]|uniref:Uncharacterized protein n=1 Tax=Pseudocohnilembus persalinus TaxID=266149 RepID=A0A0V0R792_PSEPJ|nr:hypothetical protein PPERSA_08488 [Pseudocohnilembus persalinus]|eukprot:KRX10085.1 hypothetical protein PPERSA_08488 [Pseudocohnilembus persalinus]